jgi:UDP-N-acetylmuramyl pentapeptide synthase
MTARLGRMLRGRAEDLSEYLVMYPMPLPKGACMIRDEVNANLPSLIAGLEFLAQAQAFRRIAVVRDVLDTGLTVRPRARDLGRRVAEAADMAVFLGRDVRLKPA